MSSLRAVFSALTHLPALAYRAVRWRTSHWLPNYLVQHRAFHSRRVPGGAPIDVMVLIVDHYEPIRALRESGDQAAGVAATAVRDWCQQYARMVSAIRDADGRAPQYTWFYAADFRDDGALRHLSEAAFRGLGEIEFHLHHAYDTEESFRAKLRDGLEWFRRAGAMWTAENQPRPRFAYIAGDWSLDNGTFDNSKSGCNTELLALRESGCYADFTFPALGSRAQPRKTNSIYYAADDPGPKSYDVGVDVVAGGEPSGDLMIFQGPLVVNWPRGAFDDGSLEHDSPPTRDRLACWLQANVHVRGRPEWVFVKLHTHGIQNWDTVLGSGMRETLAAMQETWGRPPFRLHFVTAREAYNIVKAAEAGYAGNPNDYRNFEVPPPANRRVYCSAPWSLRAYRSSELRLELHDIAPARVQFAEGPLRSVAGKMRALHARFAAGELVGLEADADGEVEVTAAPGSYGGVSSAALACRPRVYQACGQMTELLRTA